MTLKIYIANNFTLDQDSTTDLWYFQCNRRDFTSGKNQSEAIFEYIKKFPEETKNWVVFE